MQVDSQKLEKKLQSFTDELLALGVKDFVLATSVEIDEGKVQYQIVFEGDEVTIARILINLEEQAPEKVQEYITKHKLIEELKILEGDHDEI